ncbi:MAG: NHL repeat-containing protein, partial [SAR324 cluster bacterium]|nr:NHL repeat-containing protein [SAR324 cluster bacterium]
MAPSEIADLVLWLDGANIDGKMNHTLQEGESVRVWKDLSGKGHDAVQSVSSHYPVLNKADRTLEFDGNGDHFNIPDHPDLSINQGDDKEITVITVYESHTHGQLRGILSRSSASGSGSTDYIYFVENYGTRGDSVYWGTGSASGGLGTWFFTPEPTQDSTHILFGSLKADGNQSGTKQFFVDGLSRSETVDFSYTVKSNIPEAQIKIGTATGFNPNQSFDGELKEIIIFSRQLNDLERKKLTNYLAKKWDLPAAVDEDGDGVKDLINPISPSLMAGTRSLQYQIGFQDLAGNQGITIDNTSDISIDTTAPLLNKVSVSTTNAKTQDELHQLAIKDDNISISVESYETLASISVDRTDGSSIPLNQQDDLGKKWSLTTTVVQGENGPGYFNLKYVDMAGNSGVDVDNTTDGSRFSFDTISPSLVSVHLVSNNPKKDQAREGDNLTLRLASDEPIELSQVTLAGNNNPDINDISDNGTEWEVSILVDQNTPENQATFSVAFNDKAGNQGTTQTSTKDRSSVNIDTTPPIMDRVRLQSNNLTQTLAMAEDQITLKFDVSEFIDNPFIFINGNKVTSTSVGSKSWEGIYTVPDQRINVSTKVGSSGRTLDSYGFVADIDGPTGVVQDSKGNLYICEYSGRKILKIDKTGTITSIGTGVNGSNDGPSESATFDTPNDLAIDAQDNIYVADYGSNLIRKIDPLGYVSTIAPNATFQGPHGIVVDEAGNIFVADRGGNKIRKIDTEGNVSDFAGSGEAKSEDGQGTDASFDGPFYLDLDASGNLYVTEYWSNLIRKISPGGLVSTFAGTGMAGSQDGDRSTATFNGPNGIALDEEGNVYVSENINHQIRKIDQDGHVTTLVGLLSPGSEDGDVAQASFNQPHGMTFDDLGNLYVADYNTDLIRKITRVSEEVEFQINLVDAAGNQATR